MSKKLGLGDIFLKDESKRFGLNAYKSLGSSYALARHLKGDGSDQCPLTYQEVSDKVSPSTLFVTATDGNHGYGVAFMAKLFNCR